MRDGVFRLTFLLPPTVLAPIGRHQPCLAGCVLHFRPAGVAEIEGPSREQVFEQARRFLRVHLKNRPATSIAATLWTPVPDRFGRPIPRGDGWQIIVNSEIAFSPTALPADVEQPAAAVES